MAHWAGKISTAKDEREKMTLMVSGQGDGFVVKPEIFILLIQLFSFFCGINRKRSAGK